MTGGQERVSAHGKLKEAGDVRVTPVDESAEDWSQRWADSGSRHVPLRKINKQLLLAAKTHSRHLQSLTYFFSISEWLVWVFQKLLIYWDFHSQPSLGFTENCLKKRKYPESDSCVDENALLMSEVRGPSCLVSTVQAGGGGVMVWGIFSFGPLVPIEHRLNTTASLSIVAEYLLMATSSRIMHHVTKLKSSQTGFLNMTMSLLYSKGLHSHQIAIQ